MAYGLINDILKKLGNAYKDLGTYYSADWSATSWSQSSTQITDVMTLGPAGLYLISVTFPTTNTAFPGKINGIASGGYMWCPSGGNDVRTLIHETTSDNVQMYFRSTSATSVTCSNTSRGKIEAIRIK